MYLFMCAQEQGTELEMCKNLCAKVVLVTMHGANDYSCLAGKLPIHFYQEHQYLQP